MVHSQVPTLEADKSGSLPEPKLGYQPRSPYKGYEAVYRKTSTPNVPKRRDGWCEDMRKNKPQSNSLLAATMIFTSGGMSLSSSIGFASSNAYGTHLQFCWFIAVIIGAGISTFLAHSISKRIFNIASSVLVIMSGVLCIVAAQSSTAVLLARYCDGIAFGLTLIPAIIAGSEQSVQRFRGYVLSAEQVGLVSGAILEILYTQFYGSKLQEKPSFMHGVLVFVYGVLALVFTFIFTMESPVFLLRKDNEDEAITCLRKLQSPSVVTNEMYVHLNESKALLQEDMTRGTAKNISNSWIPMIKMIVFRSFVTMSFSFPLTLTFLMSTSLSSRSGIPLSLWIYPVMRLLGVIFSVFFMDIIGRKIPASLSLFVGGVIMFSIGCLVPDLWNMTGRYVQPIIFLLFLYQLLSGIMAPTSTCFLGEAFSPSVKPYFMLVVVIFENVIQIVFCFLTAKYFLYYFPCVLGGLQVLYAIFFFVTMPETMNMTLRQTIGIFQNKIPICNNEEEEDEAEEVDV